MIGTLQRVDFSHTQHCQALILSQTRELAQQTQAVCTGLGTYVCKGTPFCHAFVGGTRLESDVKRLEQGVTVAVGTPGRIFDVIKRGHLRTAGLRTVVLDEADEMLSQGFAEQVHEIFRFLPRDIQIALFSATMPEEVGS